MRKRQKFHVSPYRKNWKVQKEGSKRPIKTFDTKQEAVDFGRDKAKKPSLFSKKTSTDPIDYKNVLNEFSNDEKFLLQIIGEFLKQVDDQIEKIKEAIARGDSDTIMKEAHTIKGAASTLKAVELSEAAYTLEVIGRSKNLDNISETVNLIEKETLRLREYFNEIKK